MRARGFTLIELMIGVTVSMLVIGTVSAIFIGQQRALQSLDLSREASNTARDAMLSMQETLGRAGYGVDPRYAFDFRNYGCPAWSAAAPCRDSVTGPDEIVFVERDPGYYWAGTPSSPVQGCDPAAPCTGHAWRIRAFDATHVTVAAQPGDTFLQGQIVLMTCQRGVNGVMGTVRTTATAAGAGDLQLNLGTAVAGNPYATNIATGHDACFDGLQGTSLFLVNRYRYHVATVSGEPWLMLDRGLDFNQNGVTPEPGAGTPDLDDEIPVARGVEGLQIAYLFQPGTTGISAPDLGGNWVVGDVAGSLEEPDPAAAAPPQGASDTDPSRFDTHPANIRGVRIRLTVRSLRKDQIHAAGWQGDPPVPAGAGAIENRNDFTAVQPGLFRRYFTSVVASTPNLRSKNPFIF
ncbi:MAG: prepilin-type N-terminal cleavage/methylation domain-containing protein [Deltaproteobacteria bacterium]